MSRRRQRQQSGAILVESLIVIGLLITSLECIWMLYRFCLYQHQAQLEARAAAWQTAANGCGESKLGGVLGSLAGASEASDVGGLRESGDSAPGWVAVSRADEGTARLDLPAPLLGKGAVSARQHFACNEKGNHAPLQLIGADGAREGALEASAEPGE